MAREDEGENEIVVALDLDLDGEGNERGNRGYTTPELQSSWIGR